TIGSDAAPSPLESMVPGAEPVRLVVWYPEFRDYYPACEMETKGWVQRHARPDWVVLDVGANVGIYTLLASRLAPEGHVHAFEPTSTAAMLASNLAAAGAENVTIHQIAVGSRSGEAEEPIYRIWGQDPERMVYPFTTIDDFVREQGLTRLDLIKIDVDGFDFEALQGARETLERFDPWVIVELNETLATRGVAAADALAWLAALGYAEAVELDIDNFLLRRGGTGTMPPTAGVTVRRDPEMAISPRPAGEAIAGIVSPNRALQNGAAATPHFATMLAMPGPRWSYGALWGFAGAALAGPAVVEVTVEVMRGTAGFGCLVPDGSTYIGGEVYLSPAPGIQTAAIFLPHPEAAEHIVVRNTSADGSPALVDIRAIEVFLAGPPAAPSPGNTGKASPNPLPKRSGAAVEPGNPLAALTALCPDAAVIVDVGAHHGHGVVDYLANFPGAMVYAFEPAPENAAALAERLAGHGARVRWFPSAVGDHEGAVVLNLNEHDGTHSVLALGDRANWQTPVQPRGSVEVPLTTLDRFAAEQGIGTIDILKLDIQGGELAALRGAAGLLARGAVRVILCEVEVQPLYAGQPLIWEIGQHLHEAGFALTHFFPGGRDATGRILAWGDAVFVRREP
ncbi:MAG: FkbM family methyltransferase, partial [Thermomicrobiales bacterium]